MKRAWLAAIGVGIVWLLAAAPAHAGGCFMWMNDGSDWACDASVSSPAECDALCSSGGWDKCYYIAGNVACEGDNNDFPVMYEPDTQDLDDDDDTDETIRWRYVVVVSDCRVVDGQCQEFHQLYRCWNDDDHN